MAAIDIIFCEWVGASWLGSKYSHTLFIFYFLRGQFAEPPPRNVSRHVPDWYKPKKKKKKKIKTFPIFILLSPFPCSYIYIQMNSHLILWVHVFTAGAFDCFFALFLVRFFFFSFHLCSFCNEQPCRRDAWGQTPGFYWWGGCCCWGGRVYRCCCCCCGGMERP